MLWLRGGDLIDGTGSPRVRADVLIDQDDGRVTQVLQGGAAESAGAGAEVLDCGGLVVCPGFIDTHAHTDLAVLSAPELLMKVAQGVTVDIVGQDGLSVTPNRADAVDVLRRELAWLLGDPPALDWSFRGVGDYLAAIDRAAPSISVGTLVAHNAVRVAAGVPAGRAASADERLRMQEVLARALVEGGLGWSTGLIYPPCTDADRAELVALCQVAAQAKRPFAVHMRSESEGILEATDEVLGLARETGVHLHVSHLKILGATNVPKLELLLGKLEEARAEGLKVTADQYPYTASSTTLAQILPGWALAGGAPATLARLGRAEDLEEIRRAMLSPRASDGPSTWLRTGPDKIVVSDISSGRRAELVGKNLREAAALAGRGDDVLGFALELLRDEALAVAMITFSQDEGVVEQILRLPWVNLCTDGLTGGRPHPRTYGSFPRVLGRYVRERGVLTLAQAVQKLSAQAADAMGLRGRGRVRAGQVADLCVFDPERVADRATYDEPVQLPAGIHAVVVRGRVAWQGGALVARAGEGVRA